MSRLLVAVALVAVACSAYAGGNPDIRIYIDFDPPNYVHEVAPEPYTNVHAYICMDMIGEGFSSVSLRMEDPLSACAGAVAAPSFIYFLGSMP